MPEQHAERRECVVNAKTVSYLLRTGTDASAPTLVFLHGFPEGKEAWLPVLTELPSVYTVILPDLPGFGDSAPLDDEKDYRVSALVSRLACFIEQVATSPVHLVGHDWGGALAWPLAGFYPEGFQSLTIINAAHPSAFVRELKRNHIQREKSHYINTLNKPGIAEELADRDFRLLARIMGDSLHISGEHYAQRLISNWTDTKKLNAMLAYYRNMPQPVPADDGEARALVIPNLAISIPVQILWGCLDEAFDEAVLNDLGHWIGKLHIDRRPDATHWLHREQPKWVAERLTAHVSAHSNL